MRRLIVGVVIVLAAAGAGCGRSAPAGATPAVATPTPQTSAAPAAQPATQAPTPSPAPTATPVDFETLIAALPDAPTGWTRSKPKGELIIIGVAQSVAEADYDKGESTIHLEITDTAFNPLELTPLSFSLVPTYSERTPGGYKKASPIGGSPGFETWDNDSNTAEVTVVVANRIIVAAKGRGVENVNPVRALVSTVDQGKLKAVK
jgi:hypothetical protein